MLYKIWRNWPEFFFHVSGCSQTPKRWSGDQKPNILRMSKNTVTVLHSPSWAAVIHASCLSEGHTWVSGPLDAFSRWTELRLCGGQKWKTKKQLERMGNVICMYTNVKMSRHVILFKGWGGLWLKLGSAPGFITTKVLTPGSGGERWVLISLSLSLSLLGCSGGSWTIEAHGCAWQNYWVVQPTNRWHSPLGSQPRSLVCWMNRLKGKRKKVISSTIAGQWRESSTKYGVFRMDRLRYMPVLLVYLGAFRIYISRVLFFALANSLQNSGQREKLQGQ